MEIKRYDLALGTLDNPGLRITEQEEGRFYLVEDVHKHLLQEPTKNKLNKLIEIAEKLLKEFGKLEGDYKMYNVFLVAKEMLSKAEELKEAGEVPKEEGYKSYECISCGMGYDKNGHHPCKLYAIEDGDDVNDIKCPFGNDAVWAENKVSTCPEEDKLDRLIEWLEEGIKKEFPEEPTDETMQGWLTSAKRILHKAKELKGGV